MANMVGELTPNLTWGSEIGQQIFGQLYKQLKSLTTKKITLSRVSFSLLLDLTPSHLGLFLLQIFYDTNGLNCLFVSPV